MKKIVFVALAVLLVSGFILTGTTQSVMAAEKDKYGGILKIAISKSPRNFGYPPKIRGFDQDVVGPAMEFLVLTNRQNETIPQLATEWKVSGDGKTFTFKLRKGVKFHDGTTFNAQAAKYNLDLWLKTPGTVLSKLKSVDVIDDYTIRLNFSGFDALTMYELSTEAYMASPTAIKKNGAKWADTHPVGTGPFKLKKYERNVALRFERFDGYWKKGRPYLDGFEWIVIRDQMTQIASLKGGELDGIFVLPAQHANTLKKLNYDLTLWYQVNRGIYGDSKNPDSIWSNRKVREAMEYAIDREAICNDLAFGFPKPLFQPVIESNPLYNPDIKPRKYDPEKAKRLLAEAGYPNGFKTTVTHIASGWPESWVAIQGYLAKVGIELRIIPVARAKYLDIRFKGGLKNGASHIVYSGENNYLYILKNHIMSTAPQFTDMARPEGLDDLVNKALVARDPETQKALVFQATKLLYKDVTFIPFNAEAKIVAMDKSVHGYNFKAYLSPNTDAFTDVWKSK